VNLSRHNPGTAIVQKMQELRRSHQGGQGVKAEDGVGGPGQVMGSKVEVVLVKVYVQVMIHRKQCPCAGFGRGQGHSQSEEGSMVWGNPWSDGIRKPHERVESKV